MASTLDKITQQAGQGLDNLINGFIARVDRALTASVGFLGGDSASNSEPTKGKSSGNWLMTFLSGGEPEAPPQEEGKKVGGNVIKQANYVMDTSPFASTQNEVYAPVVPKQVAPRGAGMGQIA